MINDKIFFDEKDPTGINYDTPFVVYGSYDGRLWSKTPAGTVKFYVQDDAKGKVLQVVQATYSTSVTITSATPQDSGLTGTITPSSATSKILVMITQPTAVVRPAEQAFGGVQVLRGSTVIYKPYNDTFAASIGLVASGSTFMSLGAIQSYKYLDSPATTTAVTYKTQGRIPSVGTGISIIFQSQDTPSTIILMEIEPNT